MNLTASSAAHAGPALRHETSLDGLRGLAVLGVILFHSAALASRPTWFSGGFLGVSVFFVISGYLMTSLLLTEHAGTGTIDVARFAARRIRRLTPASLTVILAAIVLARPGWTAWSGFRATDALAAIWGVMNWHVIRLGTAQVIRGIGPLGPYWSLAVELQFYLALALLSLPMRRSRNPRRWLWGFAGAAWTVGAVSMLFVDASDIHREFGTQYRIAELATGMILALLFGRQHRTLPPSTSRGLTIVGGAATLAVIAGFLFADFTPPWLLAGGFLLVAAVSAVLVHALLRSVTWRRMYGTPAVVWVGNLSYSLYLVHWPVGLLLARHVSARGAPAIALNVVVTFLVAFALHHLVEERLRHWSAPSRTVVIAGLGASAAASLLALALLP